MDVVPLVCSVVAIAATLTLLDGRIFPREPENDYVTDWIALPRCPVFGIGKTKAYDHVNEIIVLLQRVHLVSTFVLPSSMVAWRAVAAGLEAVAGFPIVYGAVDGCLVMVKRFRQHEGWYYRKGFPAFNLMTLADD
ncbi:hypothetical protein H257_01573 [Aphanomyces astaci]|uniref:Uncharacterized protein n=1 Tax=Aphanomyces astaci TaxID=112090 RepID=W4H9P1_APHAT|nr:hypothetical protein H257_01573 [Aphanomyces astaci]ETV88281.1 hypothetical protein H257_01573 [Aphanomyces astaci]|eukprot:XP_009823144.1 hypothetical protein H257_01573 [Aphanomyces astaci]